MATFTKYVNRATREVVTAMKYNDVRDFPLLQELVRGVISNITPAHTRIYEGNWIVRKGDNSIEIISCSHTSPYDPQPLKDTDTCFTQKYELFK